MNTYDYGIFLSNRSYWDRCLYVFNPFNVIDIILCTLLLIFGVNLSEWLTFAGLIVGMLAMYVTVTCILFDSYSSDVNSNVVYFYLIGLFLIITLCCIPHKSVGTIYPAVLSLYIGFRFVKYLHKLFFILFPVSWYLFFNNTRISDKQYSLLPKSIQIKIDQSRPYDYRIIWYENAPCFILHNGDLLSVTTLSTKNQRLEGISSLEHSLPP